MYTNTKISRGVYRVHATSARNSVLTCLQILSRQRLTAIRPGPKLQLWICKNLDNVQMLTPATRLPIAVHKRRGGVHLIGHLLAFLTATLTRLPLTASLYRQTAVYQRLSSSFKRDRVRVATKCTIKCRLKCRDIYVSQFSFPCSCL